MTSINDYFGVGDERATEIRRRVLEIVSHGGSSVQALGAVCSEFKGKEGELAIYIFAWLLGYNVGYREGLDFGAASYTQSGLN